VRSALSNGGTPRSSTRRIWCGRSSRGSGSTPFGGVGTRTRSMRPSFSPRSAYSVTSSSRNGAAAASAGTLTEHVPGARPTFGVHACATWNTRGALSTGRDTSSTIT
jgi:hypothetical protein